MSRGKKKPKGDYGYSMNMKVGALHDQLSETVAKPAWLGEKGIPLNLPKLPPIPKKPAKSKVLRKEAKGKPCMVRIPGYCLPGNETVVLAHYSMAGYFGRGLKADDEIFGAWACDGCHRAIDGKVRTEFTKDQLRLWHCEAILRTQMYRMEHGRD